MGTIRYCQWRGVKQSLPRAPSDRDAFRFPPAGNIRNNSVLRGCRLYTCFHHSRSPSHNFRNWRVGGISMNDVAAWVNLIKRATLGQLPKWVSEPTTRAKTPQHERSDWQPLTPTSTHGISLNLPWSPSLSGRLNV